MQAGTGKPMASRSVRAPCSCRQAAQPKGRRSLTRRLHGGRPRCACCARPALSARPQQGWCAARRDGRREQWKAELSPWGGDGSSAVACRLCPSPPTRSAAGRAPPKAPRLPPSEPPCHAPPSSQKQRSLAAPSAPLRRRFATGCADPVPGNTLLKQACTLATHAVNQTPLPAAS